MEEIKDLKNSDSEDRATAAQCPQSIFSCNSLKVFVQRVTAHENLKHYYFCEDCNYITLTQQALEAHLHVAHQPQCMRMTHTNDSERADHVQFQCNGFFQW